MNIEEMTSKMKKYLRDRATEPELKHKAELACEILRLKKEKNAVILAHNYMSPDLYYSVADYTGDSLELSRKAAGTDCEVIVFCGVEFMAETAKILSPDKTVLIPAEKAGCSLAAGITAEDVRQLKARHPGVPVVTYINTYAEVKAECDVCCTSGNAAKVVEALDSDTVIFLPDEYLGRNVARRSRKQIIFPPRVERSRTEPPTRDGNMIVWDARCEVHEQFTPADIARVRADYPDVVVLAHPECSPEVVDASDFAGSTSAMIRYVEETTAPRYLLLTESAMGENVAAAFPDKEILPLCRIRCPHMALITLENTRDALKYNRYIVEVPEDIRKRAARAVERMLTIG
ncbi:quinolinate synthase NadA [Desulfococcus sp.]|uniref:quinolinate synthase NadA n=1 Tax=Desulfococcus sp. TaxID=2025834 RepID=UPI003D0CA12A